jgi:quinol-cytochrome oxidoreductase complex cytochrome b subunit
VKRLARETFGPLDAFGWDRALESEEPGQAWQTVEDRLPLMRSQLARLSFYRRVCATLATILLLVAFIGLAVWLAQTPPEAAQTSSQAAQSGPRLTASMWFAVVGAIGAILLFALRGLLFQAKDLQIQREDLESDIEIQKKPEPDQPWWQFKGHEYALRRYYRLALRQSRVMLTVGLLCMAFGVAVIITAILLLVTADNPGATETIVTGALGGIGGFLAEYVAAIYLKMYAATAQALNDFHSRFVSTHHLHLANYIASKIQNQWKREEAWDAVAREVARL